VGKNVEDHIEVASLAPLASSISLTAKLEVLSIFHARGNPDVDLARLMNPSCAAAVAARVGDDLAPATALGTGCGGNDLAERSILGSRHLAGAAAIAAD